MYGHHVRSRIRGIGTLFAPDHKLYTSDYDSHFDSVASENKPLEWDRSRNLLLIASWWKSIWWTVPSWGCEMFQVVWSSVVHVFWCYRTCCIYFSIVIIIIIIIVIIIQLFTNKWFTVLINYHCKTSCGLIQDGLFNKMVKYRLVFDPQLHDL